MEDPQGLTQLPDDFLGLDLGAQRPFQQKVQGVPLDVFLNDDILTVPLRRLIDQGQVAAGTVQQFPVDLSVAGKTAENETPPALPVPDQPHTAPGTLLQHAEGLILLLQARQKPAVHDVRLPYNF